jgi:hypothetical protein
MRVKGMRTGAIAAELGCDSSAISHALAEPEVQAMIEEGGKRLIRDASQDVRGLLSDAILNLGRLARGEPTEDGEPVPPAVQLAAVREILARTAVGAADRLDVASVAVTDERLAATLSRLRKEIEDDGG